VLTPENFTIILAKENNEQMSSDEDEENDENDDEEMEEEENDSDDGDSNDGNHSDNMEEDDEIFVPVELEDFEKLLQTKETAIKTAIQNAQKQNEDNYINGDDNVEEIWKPVHQGFGCGIGVLLNGQLPKLDLPAELDELKGGI
jgi:hypothetical protein